MKLSRILILVQFLFGIIYNAIGQSHASITLFDDRELDIIGKIDSIPLITINEQGQIYKTNIDINFDADSIIVNDNEAVAKSFHIFLWTIIDEKNNDVIIKYLQGNYSEDAPELQLLHSQLKDIISQWKFVGTPKDLHDIDYYHLFLHGYIECYIKI